MQKLIQRTRAANEDERPVNLVYDDWWESTRLTGIFPQIYKFYCFQLMGSSLYEIKNEQLFSSKCICQVGIEVTKQLRTLHELGYVHLDIKPDNILTNHKLIKTREKETQFVKRRNLVNSIYIIDFGNIEKCKLPDGKLRP